MMTETFFAEKRKREKIKAEDKTSFQEGMCNRTGVLLWEDFGG